MVWYGGVNCPPEISLPEPDLNTAVFIGRLEPDTGAIEYAQTVAQLKRRFGVSMTLRLCGDGSLRGRLQTIVNNLGIEAIFHGIVNSPERHFLQSGIAFVSSYLAILEAMAYRQLVCSIYTNPLKQDYLKVIPGAQDMMIISCNAEDLAIQLYTHLMNPEMAQSKIEKGYQFAQGHTWELVADTYCTLWARR
jgi:glycosyltransferase involved in cell wall biosynthesis